MITNISPARTLRLTSLTATMLPVSPQISLRPTPRFMISIARSDFGSKILDRCLTVRMSAPVAILDRAIDGAPLVWIAPG